MRIPTSFTSLQFSRSLGILRADLGSGRALWAGLRLTGGVTGRGDPSVAAMGKFRRGGC